MSTWRDQLQAASWRDAPFFVNSHEAGIGRRVKVHEYPLRDKPYSEDMGRKTRVFSVEAFVLGTDYMAARDRLVAACEQPGAGKLVHPYLGELTCSVTDSKFTESTAEGGLARFTLSFVESGDKQFPSATVSTSAAVASAGDAATSAVQSAFASRSSVAGRPAFVANASATIFSSALASIQSSVGTVRGAADQVSALQRDIDAAQRDLTTLIYAPASAGQALASAIRQLVRSVATTPADALSLARTLYGFGTELPAISPSTTSRKAQAQNQDEMLRLVRVVAAAEGARAVTGVTFDSYQAAIGARDEIVDLLDDVMLQDGVPDEVYDALRVLSAAVVRDVTARGANLARLVEWAPGRTAPVLVLAQQLYADATRETELIARNAIRHPLFVPGAIPLEVLGDA